MGIEALIQKYLHELPEQIRLLCEANAAIADAQERQRCDDDVRSYEHRMREGFEVLQQLDSSVLSTIQSIREASPSLLEENAQRYRGVLATYRKQNDIQFSNEEHCQLVDTLKAIPLSHSSRNAAKLRKHGVHPASELWLSTHKSTANPMDIVLGLDRYCFLTHGFSLPNYGEASVDVHQELLELSTTVVSTVDIFKLVLIATGKVIPCAIPTQDWTGSLEEYSRQLFSGKDFMGIKADYIFTFFENTEEYHRFAAKHFYENHSECAPRGEQPFLGEVKVLGAIGSDLIMPEKE